MSLFSSPVPQWPEFKTVAAFALRLVPVLDPVSGIWAFQDGATPSGTLKIDVTSGVMVFDQTTIVQSRKVTKPPNGVLTFY